MEKKKKQKQVINAGKLKENFENIKMQLEKKFGKDDMIFMMEDQERLNPDNFVPTGHLGIDLSIGAGYPKRRIIEIYGANNSGKTSLSLFFAKAAQTQGLSVLFVDVENSLENSHLSLFDIDKSNLAIAQPNSGEEALELIETATSFADLIIVDSVSALTPISELENEMGGAQMGSQARLMSQALRKITAINKNATIIFLNQTRQKIGATYGPQTTTSGGMALPFYSSLRCEIKRTELLKEGEIVYGQTSLMKVIKNKCAIPFKQTEFNIYFGVEDEEGKITKQGILPEESILSYALKYNIIEQKGAWFKYEDLNIAQGKDKALLYLLENSEITEKIREKIMLKLG